jgi:antitoxin (DNA-binding transcriptional repressor) of toxin-antitoxin stability system
MAIRVLRMPMTKARTQLGSLVRGVHVEGDVVVLEKDGIPVAALVDIDAVEDYLETKDPALRRRLRASMRAYRLGRGRPARQFLAELKAEETE